MSSEMWPEKCSAANVLSLEEDLDQANKQLAKAKQLIATLKTRLQGTERLLDEVVVYVRNNEDFDMGETVRDPLESFSPLVKYRPIWLGKAYKNQKERQ